MRYQTFTLRIERSDDAPALTEDEIGEVMGATSDAEDVINDALPEGYYCKIDHAPEGVDIAAVERLEAFAREAQS